MRVHVLFIAATVALSACQIPTAEQRLTDSYQALSERVMEHAETTDSTDDAGLIRAETADYCADMAVHADDMEEACDDMMSDGDMMMGSGGMEHDSQTRLLIALDGLRSEVDGHCASIEKLDNADALVDECDDHDAQMDTHLDALGDEMPQGAACSD